ncbi:hypothetical protein AUR64_06095 [Haloprofundus marisrubri]|uniref:Uncharacterized protein n=1 Tax=Haloprofundus marisrubri TaxID=1514971 RepID=A0A0W1RB81_9EURY|nr:hypothetical protein [Haloprofundus marisrubri]KTG10759.1 hypothetical protein AUR64_06095 [Haloprofundus marisrubri]
MSDVPERPESGGLVQALSVPQHAKVGVLAGVALALCAYLFRVLELFGPFGGTQEFPFVGPEGWFLLLAFVLATTTAMLVTAALTVVSALRLARDL